MHDSFKVTRLYLRGLCPGGELVPAVAGGSKVQFSGCGQGAVLQRRTPTAAPAGLWPGQHPQVPSPCLAGLPGWVGEPALQASAL